MPAPSWGSDRRDVSPPRDDSTPTRECPQTSPTFGPGKGPHPLTAFAKPVMPRTNSTVSWPTTTGSEAPSGDKDAELGVASPTLGSKRAGPRMGKLAKPTMLRSLTAMSWTSDKTTQNANQDDSPHREEPALKKSASRISFSSWRSGSSGGSGKKKQQKPATPGDGPNYVEEEELLEGERRIRFRPSAIVSEPQAIHEPQGGNPNKIRTARFTMLTWLPLSLFHQFQRVANVYFLCIVVLVMFPWSPKDWKSKVFPFSLVLFWTACKDLHEDARRRRDDALENNQKTTAFDIDKKKFVEKDWQDILVGDVILVDCDKAFPADLILLYAGGSHEAFISTITLDGETNLKERVPPAICESFAVEVIDTPGSISKKFKVAKVADTAMKVMHEMHTQFFSCKVGKPEVAVQDVKGTLRANTMGEACPISFSNFLPRGCVLRNTGWILALVVYVGDETKTRLNTAQSRNKVSNMQKYLNQCVWGLLAGLFLVCCYAATARVAIDGEFSPCCDEDSWLIRFCVFMITFYHVVPMSLYVVFEMLKLLLGWQVNTDPQMKDPHTGELAVARTADLIEEMGQINFAFSDKTGTLTKNEMVFARACVGGKDLGDFRSAETGMLPEAITKARDKLGASSLDRYWTDVHWFFTCLATCHSVQVSFAEKEDHGEKSCATSPGLSEKSKGLDSLGSTGTEGRRYLGMSPDEVCLVEVAQQVGIAFTSRTRPVGKGSYASEVTLQTRDGSLKVFSILYELEFNSDRKRMSVIMREGNEVYLVTKGADIVMEPLLTENLSKEYQDCLKQYSQSGLRTLVIAYKKIDRQYLKSWERDYKHALNLLDSTKDAQIAQVSARIEHGLTLLGITGVEDCLQDGVPKAIATLKECGVRVWVLTGDKTETAVDIARSCMLFVDQTTLAYGTEASDVEDALSRLQEARRVLEGRSDAGLVLDGRTLQYALQSEECRQLIFELGIASRSCVCCRLTPLQKRQLVELVRQKDPSTITLAVGDGANDVPMIEGAHLGIAIRGKEGAQAVQVSDVAISQFRFLVPLLLCHGRRAYRRIAIYLCYYLYKNVVLAMGDVVWMHMDEYRGRIAFPEWVSINYNVFFTSWHILFLLGFDQDVPDEVANAHPEIYLVGPKRALFNKLIFSRWMVFALYHGVVAWVVPYYMISVDEVYDKERPNGWWEGSITSFTIIVFIVLLKLLLSTQSPFRLVTSILPTIASLVCYFMGLGIIGYMPMFTNPKPEGLQPNMKEIPGETFGNSKALIAMAVVPAVVFIGDLIFEITLKTVWPTPLDKVKAKVLLGET